jgi:phosphoserine phosphatase
MLRRALNWLLPPEAPAPPNYVTFWCDTYVEAKTLCRTLKASGIDCFVRSSGGVGILDPTPERVDVVVGQSNEERAREIIERERADHPDGVQPDFPEAEPE